MATVTTRKILEKAIGSLRDDIFFSVYHSNISKYYKRGKSYYESALLNDIDILESKYFRSLIEIINDSVQIIIMATAIALLGIENLINSTTEIRNNILSLINGKTENYRINGKAENYESSISDGFDLEINNLSLSMADKKILDNFT